MEGRCTFNHAIDSDANMAPAKSKAEPAIRAPTFGCHQKVM